MGNLLDSPKTDKSSELVTTRCGLTIGATGMQGWRLEMEDSHIIDDMPSQNDHTFVAIFDGHGGAGAAAFAADRMISFVENTKEWNDYISGGCKSTELLGEALRNAFLNIDDALRKHQQEGGQDASGCTSVTAMITPGYIVCANAGDSRCVLGTNGSFKAMSEDHKPYDEGERRRIEEAGGSVQWKRVDGDLAVSRALGDFQYKTRPDLPPQSQKVTCFPDIVVHTRTPQDEALLLACDGLWDVMANEEAISLVREIMKSGEGNVALVAEEMIDLALHKGSKDNISAVIVQLPAARIGPASGGGVERRRQQRDAALGIREAAAEKFSEASKFEGK